MPILNTSNTLRNMGRPRAGAGASTLPGTARSAAVSRRGPATARACPTASIGAPLQQRPDRLWSRDDPAEGGGPLPRHRAREPCGLPVVLPANAPRGAAMSDDQPKPDLLAGVALDAIPDGGLLAGRIGERDAVLVRRGTVVRALGGQCTHLGAPMAKGLVVGGRGAVPVAPRLLRRGFGPCHPGAGLRPAADLARDGRWRTGVGHVGRTPAGPGARHRHRARPLRDRRRRGGRLCGGRGAEGAGARGPLHPPVGGAARALRPHAADQGLPRRQVRRRPPADQRHHAGVAGVDLRRSARVVRIDRDRAEVVLAGGEAVPYAALLLATGAEPKRLDVPGGDQDHVRVLRSLDDCRAILGRLAAGTRVVVLGSSFIGLEPRRRCGAGASTSRSSRPRRDPRRPSSGTRCRGPSWRCIATRASPS